MQRNWDTVREILLAIEKLEPTKTLVLSHFDESRAYEISYHVLLLEEAGLITASISRAIGHDPTQFHARSLTWEGHEFLDSIRELNTWDKTKQKIAEKGGVMTFDVIKTVASGAIKSALGL